MTAVPRAQVRAPAPAWLLCLVWLGRVAWGRALSVGEANPLVREPTSDLDSCDRVSDRPNRPFATPRMTFTTTSTRPGSMTRPTGGPHLPAIPSLAECNRLWKPRKKTRIAFLTAANTGYGRTATHLPYRSIRGTRTLRPHPGTLPPSPRHTDLRNSPAPSRQPEPDLIWNGGWCTFQRPEYSSWFSQHDWDIRRPARANRAKPLATSAPMRPIDRLGGGGRGSAAPC